jgi:hypothetical protein
VDLRCALHGICGIDRHGMFVHMVLVHMVEMTIVKIVHMPVMANRGVSAIRAMAMGVVLMVLFGASDHRHAPYCAWFVLDAPGLGKNNAKGSGAQGAHKKVDPTRNVVASMPGTTTVPHIETS